MPEPQIPSLREAIIAQALGFAIASVLIVFAFSGLLDRPLAASFTQGASAAVVSHKLGAPRWWLPIHLLFMPLVVLAHGLDLHPAWYLSAFVVLLLTFWRTDQSRVPLYLSNRITVEAIAALLPRRPCAVIDLGCGNGRVLSMLARLRPDCRFFGLEHAPLPWLWARLSCLDLANCRIQRGDFWRQSLAGFDVVYAFLSPPPMHRLWSKARAEMPVGALLISNSFPVPDQAPEQVVPILDRRATRLYCYRPGNPDCHQSRPTRRPL